MLLKARLDVEDSTPLPPAPKCHNEANFSTNSLDKPLICPAEIECALTQSIHLMRALAVRPFIVHGVHIPPPLIIIIRGGGDVNAMYYKRPHSRRAHQMYYTLCKCTLDLRLGLLQELEIYRGTARSISAVISSRCFIGLG